jgi:hypothetical protein
MPHLYGQQRVLFGEAPIVGSSSGNITVALIDKDHADRIIRAGHYSGTTVWSSNVHLGIFVEDALIGAMQFGPAMNPASGMKIVADSTPDTWLELNRLWLADDKPANAASRAISCALKVIRARKPKVEWIQSFADERCGKYGGVYQACSFLYCGEHTAKFYELDGELFHQSMLSRPSIDVRGWRSGPKVARLKQRSDEATLVEYRQFRYLKFLSAAARRKLLLPVLPYPKPDERRRNGEETQTTERAEASSDGR